MKTTLCTAPIIALCTATSVFANNISPNAHHKRNALPGVNKNIAYPIPSERPEPDMHAVAENHIANYPHIMLVAVIKTFRHNNTIYTACRVVNIFKGNLVPRYSILLLKDAPHYLINKNEDIHENDADVFLLLLQSDECVLLSNVTDQEVKLPDDLSEAEQIISPLKYSLPSLSNLCYIPHGYWMVHSKEIYIGSLILQKLENTKRAEE